MKNIIKIIMVIIGTLIGAGFASGREIYLFFVRYGNLGKIGLLISCFITTIIIYKTLYLIKKIEIKEYKNLLEIINHKYKKINLLILWIVNLFLLISFFIMVAGFSAYLNQIYRIPNILSSIIFVLICYFVFLKNLNGILKANEILVPILIVFILYLGIINLPYVIKSNGQIYIETFNKGFITSAILYASYNSLILIPVITTLKDYIKNKKQINIISVFCGMFIGLLSFTIYGLLLKGQFYIKELELPLLEVVLEYGEIFKLLYGFVIIISIFTSAISAGYSFLQNVSTNDKNYKLILKIMCIMAIFISTIGFSKLVEILYPFFGMLGIIQIILILKINKQNNIKTLNNKLNKYRKIT